MILVTGETLLDVFQDAHQKNHYQSYPGGAPANVAVMLHALNLPVRFFTVVGTDERGNQLYQTLEKLGLDTSQVFRDATVKTPFAFVEQSSTGPHFEFYHFNAPLKRYPVHFDFKSLDEFQLVVGSGVIVTNKAGYQFQKKLFKKAHQKQCLIALDFNIRPLLTEDMVKLRKRLIKLSTYADVIKISTDDYGYFTDHITQSPFDVFDLKKTAQVILTDGAKGAKLYTQEAVYETHGIPVDAIDTTGAGDAFMGAFLKGYLTDPNHHEHNLSDANKKAALSTTFKGAMTALMQFKDPQSL